MAATDRPKTQTPRDCFVVLVDAMKDGGVLSEHLASCTYRTELDYEVIAGRASGLSDRQLRRVARSVLSKPTVKLALRMLAGLTENTPAKPSATSAEDVASARPSNTSWTFEKSKFEGRLKSLPGANGAGHGELKRITNAAVEFAAACRAARSRCRPHPGRLQRPRRKRRST